MGVRHWLSTRFAAWWLSRVCRVARGGCCRRAAAGCRDPVDRRGARGDRGRGGGAGRGAHRRLARVRRHRRARADDGACSARRSSRCRSRGSRSTAAVEPPSSSVTPWARWARSSSSSAVPGGRCRWSSSDACSSGSRGLGLPGALRRHRPGRARTPGTGAVDRGVGGHDRRGRRPEPAAYSGAIALALGLPQLTGPVRPSRPLLVIAVLVLLCGCARTPISSPDRSRSRRGVGIARRPRLRDGLAHLRRHRRAMLGIIAVSIGHVVMVMVMVMTPVHMSARRRLAAADRPGDQRPRARDVRVLAGRRVARRPRGARPMILVGALILRCRAVSALRARRLRAVLAIGLFLLGLGWSCTLIAGSTLLTDDVGQPTDRRSKGCPTCP